MGLSGLWEVHTSWVALLDLRIFLGKGGQTRVSDVSLSVDGLQGTC